MALTNPTTSVYSQEMTTLAQQDLIWAQNILLRSLKQTNEKQK